MSDDFPSLEPGRQINFSPSSPHGWLQWKGTIVCMDVHCACGHSGHIDGPGQYFLQCPECGRVYEVNGHVEMIEVRREDPVSDSDAWLREDVF